jgi:glycosyltransferase involved in cell wall biosynthesis
MRILHLFNEIRFSGAEIMYANAAPIFHTEGLEQLAFSTGESIGSFGPELEKVGFIIYHKPINFNPVSLRGYKFYKEFFNFLKNEHIDVLHIHRSNLYFVAIIAWLAGVRCVKTQHSTFRNRWFTLPYSILRRSVLRSLCKVTFQTIGESVYHNELKYYKNPSVRVNNWFDDKKFYPAQTEVERLEQRDKLSIPHDTFVIISMGSCSSNKNHFDIIKALALVKSKINCVYIHLGHGHTEPEEKELAKELGVSNFIYFLGNRVNVRDYLIAADLFVMTSKFEGLGNAALEAMACKLPSIFYDAPGLRDLIKNDNNGFLIAPNHELLAEKIIYYQQNPSIAKQKAENAHCFVNKEFSMDVNVRKIFSLYNHRADLVLHA